MTNLLVLGAGRMGRAVSDMTPVTFLGREDAIPDDGILLVTVPGRAFDDVYKKIAQRRGPVIVATTGHQWPADIDAQLKARGAVWVWGGNFSLGMQAMRHAIQAFANVSRATGEVFENDLTETHHAQKQDAPSGTALLWQNWIGGPKMDIESLREGEHLPRHVLTCKNEFEEVFFGHQTHDRRVYAQGIVWLVQHLARGLDMPAGLHSFETMFDQISGIMPIMPHDGNTV